MIPIPFEIWTDYPKTMIAALLATIVFAIYAGVQSANHIDAKEREIRAYMAVCIEKHTEVQCAAFRRWGREDLGTR